MPKIAPNSKNDTTVRTFRRIMKNLSILGTEKGLTLKERVRVAEICRYFQQHVDAAETALLLNKAAEVMKKSNTESAA